MTVSGHTGEREAQTPAVDTSIILRPAEIAAFLDVVKNWWWNGVRSEAIFDVIRSPCQSSRKVATGEDVESCREEPECEWKAAGGREFEYEV